MRGLAIIVPLLGAVLLTAGPALASAAINVSGDEEFPGIEIGGVHHGDAFGGWTGGGGQVPGGWSSPPGTGGTWAGLVDYTGTSGLGRTVTILPGGRWALALKNGQTRSGAVLGGAVTWPPSPSSADPRCGTSARSGTLEPVGALTATARVATGTNPALPPGATVSLNGCLDDQPASYYLNPKTILRGIRPHIWGAFAD